MEVFSPDAPLSTVSDGSPAQSTADSPGTSSVATALGMSVNGDGRPSQLAPPPVSAACLACRDKHLKCDGLTPCSRCTSSSSECVYVASRRGYKGPRRNTAQNPNKRHASSSPPLTSGPADSCPMMLGHVPVSIPPSTVAAFNPSIVLPDARTPTTYASTPAMTNTQLYRNPFAPGSDAGPLVVAPPVQQTPVASQDERCLDAFYHYFHGGHPFVLPRDFLLRLTKEGTFNTAALVAAIRYIGSLYLDVGPARAMYFDEAIRLCYLPSTPKDGFLIQALLLLIIGLDGSCQQDRARQLLSDCERFALEINLNTRQFAGMNGRGIPVLEESWRRTWWELYVCDGMIAGVHRVTNFLLFDIAADVALPCEEHQFLSGNIPQPMYIEDFDDQLFSGDDREFSSFTYRIAAARNLGRFMRMPASIFPEDENIARVDALLANWKMHLPESKRDNLTKHCQLDEMMFQAHFITHACTIMLHQPLSQLDSSPARAVTSCAPHRHIPSGEAFNTHTKHTVSAAREISKMVTQAVPMLSHTHFFTCVVTLSSIVHLSQWAFYFIEDEDDLRQQIRLNIGALNKLSEVWKAANTASSQVKGVAQEIYREKKAHQISPAFWVGFTQEQMISSINADENIMNDLENMLTQVSQP